MVVEDTCEGDVVFRNHGTAMIIEYSSAGRLERHGCSNLVGCASGLPTNSHWSLGSFLITLCFCRLVIAIVFSNFTST